MSEYQWNHESHEMEQEKHETGENWESSAVGESCMESQAQVRRLRGKLRWEGDLDEMRRGRFLDVDR
jgi:hypothetical protein